MIDLFRDDASLNLFTAGKDLKLEADKPEASAGRNKAASSSAELKNEELSMKLEVTIGENRSKANGTVVVLIKSSFAALLAASQSQIALEQAKTTAPEIHKAAFYDALVSTVSKRADALWVALGRKLPVCEINEAADNVTETATSGVEASEPSERNGLSMQYSGKWGGVV